MVLLCECAQVGESLSSHELVLFVGLAIVLLCRNLTYEVNGLLDVCIVAVASRVVVGESLSGLVEGSGLSLEY